ncbi:MAG: thermonuclease family protein [Actinobacteria bacterium]|nr:thermonuclease family protein [Actinomycetota bacterium]
MKKHYLKIEFLILFVLSLIVLSSCGLYYFDSEAGKNDIGKNSNNKNYTSESLSSGFTDADDSYEYIGKEKKEIKEPLYKVTEIIDGDTLIVDDSETVRLTGINTPESGMFFYEEAKAVLAIICGGKEISLEKDVTDRDQYGRLLRYAFAGNVFINLEMVKKGFASAFTLPPDIKYQDLFIDAERTARSKNLGLWERSEYNYVISVSGQKSQAAISIEIHWDADGDDKKNMNDEYVSFKNNTDKNIDIGGWTVKDSATNTYEFKKYCFKSCDEITLYSGQGNDGEGNFYWKSNMPVWNNSTDTLYLRDSKGLLVSIFSY